MQTKSALVKDSDKVKCHLPAVAIEDNQRDDTRDFDRESLVAENAYIRGKQRGVAVGDSWSEWFEAETDVECARGRDPW